MKVKEAVSSEELREFEKSVLADEPNVIPETSTPPAGYGDAEHDTRLHRNLKPHTCPPEYDARNHHYRDGV